MRSVRTATGMWGVFCSFVVFLSTPWVYGGSAAEGDPYSGEALSAFEIGAASDFVPSARGQAVDRTGKPGDLASGDVATDGVGFEERVGPTQENGLVAAGGIVAGPECVLLGNLVTQFNRNLVFRANIFHVQEAALISEFGFVLDIDPNISVDLYFSIHNGPFPFTANADFPANGIVISVPVDPLRNGPELFTTGSLAVPVSLLVDTDYVLGVAWGTESLIYGRDPAQSTTPGTVFSQFPNATFVGAASRTITVDQLPTPETILVLPSPSGGPWAMEVCVTGACCIGGSCVDVTGTQCQVLGGFETSPGVTCERLQADGLGCPLVTAACCTNFSCAIETKFECEGGGGRWFLGSDCADPVLCEPKGACCTTAGSCLNLVTQPACEGIGGTYRGDDTDCATVNPQCNRGACCLGPGNCDLRAPGVEAFECDASRGDIFHGFGVSCDPNPCVVTGACCVGATCSDLTQADCTLAGGTYRGNDSECATLAIACGSGACCRAGIGCTDAAGIGIPESQCDNLSGTYRGDGTNCDTIVPACPGVCCEPGNFCSDNVDPTTCNESLFGVFGGATTCATASPCDNIAASGACCMPNGNCVTTSDTACVELEGTFSASQSCVAVTCVPASPVGGCCLPDESCALFEAVACEALGGVFRGDGIDCPSPGESDCLRGSCCLIAGGCEPDVVLTECDEMGGSFQSGVSCVGAMCAEGGACCLPNETCATLAADLCVAADGVFQGVGVDCLSVTTCARGACCGLASCTETLEANCSGTYLGDGAICVPNACDTGACCRDGQPCAITTVAACAADGGVHTGASTTCLDAPCLRGACCHGDGTCDEDALNFMCMAPLDELSGGLACTQVDCQPRGACCLNGVCGDGILIAQCLDLGGFPGVAGSLCGDFTSPCDLGVCCLDDGRCVDEALVGVPMVRMACETLQTPAGVFTQDGNCATVVCQQPGACCLSDGGCSFVPENQCIALGGSFVAEDAACAPTTCAQGACCALDTTCVENRGFECELMEGLFSVGFVCGDGVFCEARGACCLPDESCTNEVAIDCFFFGGLYAGDGVGCAATACATGACCELDGTCTDGGTEFACAASDGFTEAAGCGSVLCEPRGACCSGAACTIEVESACAGLGGDFQGVNVACEDISCVPLVGGCCNGITCSVATQVDCLAGGGSYLGDNTTCVGAPCGMISIVSSVPASGSIDARQPHLPTDITPTGWISIELTFDGDAGALVPGDFSISATGGAAPTIVAVTPLGNAATVDFNVPIPTAAWTQITHIASGSSVCLAYLPADANGDGTSGPADILAVIDSLNGIAPRPAYATDTDRSGVAGPEDILRVIDLLNGAAMFDVWLDQSLAVSPCPGG